MSKKMTDPSEIACRIYDTFFDSRPVYDPMTLPKHFSMEIPRPLSHNNKKTRKNINYWDTELYDHFSELRKKVVNGLSVKTQQERDKILNDVEPFMNIGESVFGNKHSIVLANIDAIYKLTGHYGSLFKQRLDSTFTKVGITQSSVYENPVGMFTKDKDFVACCVQDPQGGFMSYLQFRLKNLVSYGMNSNKEDWRVSCLSTKYLNITYGQDGTGELDTNWKYFIDLIRGRVLDGVHLFLANGTESLERQSIVIDELMGDTLRYNHKTILQEVIVGLSCCGEKGNMVIKVLETNSPMMTDLLFLVSQCFEAIDLFKPITISNTSNEKYFIGLQRRSDDITNMYIEILKKAEKEFESDKYKRIIREELQEDFIDWITETNNNLLSERIDFLEKLNKLLNEEKVSLRKYNLRTALKIWSLPGNIPKERDFKRI